MKFYIGLHHVNHAQHFDRSFISINRLRGRKSDFIARDWILDSGAFTEILTYGDYRFPSSYYAKEIDRWSICGNMELAVSQDYMCEPFMLQRTGRTTRQHQTLTISRYDSLVQQTDIPIMPVLQGYDVEDYIVHIAMYGERLIPNMRVGVGSVCKRNKNPRVVARILESIKVDRPDLKLHGFGLKKTALESLYISSLLYSADSMAWSYNARRQGRNANGLVEALEFMDGIEGKQGTKPHQLELVVVPS